MQNKSPQQKFLETNKNTFLKYFDNISSYCTASQVYDNMLNAGNVKGMTVIIRERSQFSWENWVKNELPKLGVE